MLPLLNAFEDLAFMFMILLDLLKKSIITIDAIARTLNYAIAVFPIYRC